MTSDEILIGRPVNNSILDWGKIELLQYKFRDLTAAVAQHASVRTRLRQKRVPGSMSFQDNVWT